MLFRSKNDTVEHQVIAVGVDHIRRAAGHGLAQTVEQPHVREHRSRCSQKRVPIGRVQFRSVLSFVGKSGKCIDHSHGALSAERSEEHTSELQSLMRISYAVFCLKKKKHKTREPPV